MTIPIAEAAPIKPNLGIRMTLKNMSNIILIIVILTTNQEQFKAIKH